MTQYENFSLSNDYDQTDVSLNLPLEHKNIENNLLTDVFFFYIWQVSAPKFPSVNLQLLDQPFFYSFYPQNPTPEKFMILK